MGTDARYQDFLAESDALVAAERWDEQGELMRRALVSYPDDSEFCLRFAVSISDTSPEEAVEYARRAAKLSEADPARLTRAAVLLYGHGLVEDAGRYARQVVPQVDETFPFAPDLFHLIGLLALKRDNKEVAEKYLRLAFQIEPNGRDHAYQLAIFLAGRGDAVGALDVIAKGLEHGPPDKNRLIELRQSLMTDAY